jgi:micrococcal nuclease
MYQYRADLVRVLDGDTIDVNIDLGLEVHTLTRIRLAGINAPEKSTPEGLNSKRFAETWFAENTVEGMLVLETVKDRREKFGRYLAYVHPYTTLGLPASLNKAMVEAGYAKEWDGRGTRP